MEYKTMKKIFLITLEYPPQIGGIATYTHELAKTLSSSHTVLVLAPRFHNKAGQEEWDSHVPYSVMRKQLFFPRILWPRWLPLLLHAFRIAKKEHVHLFMIHHVLPSGYVAKILKKFLHIPYVVFFHGADITSAKSTRLWKQKMIRFVAKTADGLVVNSEQIKKRLHQILRDEERAIQVLYPCVDAAFFDPPAQEALTELKRRYALNGKRVLLSVSRIGEGKGFPHLARMLPAILRAIPNAVWVVVGDGPKKDALVAYVEQNGLQNAVRFIGALTPNDVKPLYYLADAFILLNHFDLERGEEGFGIVFLEAAGAGLPVIAGRTGGVEEAVLHTETGLIVDAYQERDVLAAITTILQNPEYGKRLGDHARARAQAEFAWAKQVKKLD